MKSLVRSVNKLAIGIVFVCTLFFVYSVDADILDYIPAILSASTNTSSIADEIDGTWIAYDEGNGTQESINQAFTINLKYLPCKFIKAKITYNDLDKINLVGTLYSREHKENWSIYYYYANQVNATTEYRYKLCITKQIGNYHTFSFEKEDWHTHYAVDYYSGTIIKQ